MNYLVKEDGSKLCKCCQQNKYIIEFADSDLFEDGKIPVCSACARSSKTKDAVQDILQAHTVTCKECQEEKNLSDFFARSSDWYKVTDKCIDCRSKRFNGFRDDYVPGTA